MRPKAPFHLLSKLCFPVIRMVFPAIEAFQGCQRGGESRPRRRIIRGDKLQAQSKQFLPRHERAKGRLGLAQAGQGRKRFWHTAWAKEEDCVPSLLSGVPIHCFSNRNNWLHSVSHSWTPAQFSARAGLPVSQSQAGFSGPLRRPPMICCLICLFFPPSAGSGGVLILEFK